jgi:hypothetical protein
MSADFTPKNADFYNCKKCDFGCSKQSDWNRHISTRKHKYRTTSNKPKNCENVQVFPCKICNKIYKVRNSLWYHEQKCRNTENTEIINVNTQDEDELNTENDGSNIEDGSNNVVDIMVKENTDFKNMIMELMKNNTELQKQMLEVCRNIQPATIISNTNNNSNNNNKTFNLQFFLNEQCKNAMNLNEFVGSFKMKLEDLFRVGEQGYIEGITYIILEKLKSIDIYHRPIHCSDLRRDTLYIRMDDIWSKEDPENSNLAKAIKDIGQKNFIMLNAFKALHPDCEEYDSVHNDKYMTLIMKASGCQKENVEKIIKKIAKEVVINK